MLSDKTNKILFDVFVIPLWRIFDFLVPKNRNYWGFPVHHIKSSHFIENTRAVFEEIKNDKKIIKIIFTRTEDRDFYIEHAVNFFIVKLNSIKGLLLLTRCKVVFLQNAVAMDFSLRWGSKLFSIVKLNLRKRLLIHVGHGIPLKKLSTLANSLVKKRAERISYRRRERKYYSGLVVSSAIDSYAMATMFNPTKYENVWITGLPRNDFLAKNINAVPVFIRSQSNLIAKMKNGRKLMTYTPTYRQTSAVVDSSYYQFSEEEMERLKSLLIKHDAVFGFRMHYFRNNDTLFNMEKYIDNKYIFDLGHTQISEIAPIIRESDIIVTDYSSVYIDSLYLNKPVFCFAYDLEHYKENQNGILYDLDIVFPGPVSTDFTSLLKEIDKELIESKQVYSERYRIAKKIFFKYTDDKNTQRVVEKVMRALNNA